MQPAENRHRLPPEPLESALVLGDTAGERCKLESPALPMTEPYYLPIGDEVEVFTAAYTKRLQS